MWSYTWQQRPSDSRTKTTTSTRFNLKFFRLLCTKKKTIASLHSTLFHQISLLCYLFWRRLIIKPFLGRKIIRRLTFYNLFLHDILAKPRSRMTTAITFSRQNRDFKIQRRDGKRECRVKSEFAFFQSLSQLFLPTYFVKCRRTLQELNS